MTDIDEAYTDVPSNMSELCRLCLSKDGGGLPIFGDEDDADCQTVPLSFRILACVSVEVSDSDELPKTICSTCLAQVNNWHSFKQLCDSSQATLKEWMTRLQSRAQGGKNTGEEQPPEESPEDVSVAEIDEPLEQSSIEETEHDTVHESETSQIVQVKEEPPDEIYMEMDMHSSQECSENSIDNNMLLDIKQEQIEECETEQREIAHVIIDDPLSFTTESHRLQHASESNRIYPVRQIKSEPFDCEDNDISITGDVDRNHSDEIVSADNTEDILEEDFEDDREETEREEKQEENGVERRSTRNRTLSIRNTPNFYSDDDVYSDKEAYFCVHCNKAFPFRSYYLRHLKVHNNRDDFMCTQCNKQFSCKRNLDRHVRLHRRIPAGGQKLYPCIYCPEVFDNSVKYARHRKNCKGPNATPKPPPKTRPQESQLKDAEIMKFVSEDSTNSDGKTTFPCYICERSFNSVHKLQTHRRTHNDFNCNRCGKSFDGGIALSNHLRRHNFDGFKRYSCKICQKNFTNISALVSHKRIHTLRGETRQLAPLPIVPKPKSLPPAKTLPPAKALPPSKSLPTAKSLPAAKPMSATSRLMAIHREIPARGGGYNCAICHKWVKTRSVLKRHMTSHTKLKLFKCSICDVSMGYASSLHKHMRLTHNIEITYGDIRQMFDVPALEEQEAFAMTEKEVQPAKKQTQKQNSAPDTALKQKGGEMNSLLSAVGNYHCNICEKVFTNKHLLNNHVKIIHMGGKAYKCNTCSKLFAYKHLLAKHSRTHAGGVTSKLQQKQTPAYEEAAQEFTCNVCFRSFPDAKTLNNHKGVHTRFKCYSCSICFKTFNGMRNWEQHQKLHSLHTSLISCRCKLCGKKFTSRSELNEHKKTHITLKIYTCGVCKNSYNSSSSLNKHKHRKHGGFGDTEVRQIDSGGSIIDEVMSDVEEVDRCYVCDICNKVYGDEEELENHKMIHLQRAPVPNKTAASNKSTVSKGAFHCDLCRRNFPDQTSLSKHKGWHSRRSLTHPIVVSAKKRLYSCNFCHRSFTNSGSLSKHKRKNCPPKRFYKGDFLNPSVQEEQQQHKKEEMVDETSAPDSPSDALSSQPSAKMPQITLGAQRVKKFPCPSCDRHFNNKRALVRHKGWHTRQVKRDSLAAAAEKAEETPSSSPVPPEPSSPTPPESSPPPPPPESSPPPPESSPLLPESPSPPESPPPPPKSSQPESPSSPLPSSAELTESKEMKDEKLTETKPEVKSEEVPKQIGVEANSRYPCNVCFKVYSSISMLDKHKRLHKRKVLPNKIIKHSDSPEPEKPPVLLPEPPPMEGNEEGLHPCRFCHKAFTFRRNLIDHERVHTGERPFSCNVCHLTFSRRAILWRHKKVHLGVRPFSCSICSKSFLLNFQLTLHMRQKHSDKAAYECMKCDKKLDTSEALEKHELTEHNE